MAVNLPEPGELASIAGVRLGTAEAAIKKPGRKDLLLVELAAGTQVAGMYTRNAFCAAPVQVCRSVHAARTPVRGLLVNSGNANAGTGAAGLAAARTTAQGAARALGGKGAVLPFSTGVIGVQLPAQRVLDALPAATAALREDGWHDAARAIMTTDTVAKAASRTVGSRSRPYHVTGIAKGAGMICPDMATLLAFVATDAPLSAAATRACLREAVGQSFNCVTVDGDTSTNDSIVLCATGAAGGAKLVAGSRAYRQVRDAVTEVCTQLAQAVVRDGEGATRFITIDVGGARSEHEARLAAYAVAHSPLVKTACFAGDANWGRILAAVGRSGVPGLDVSRVSVRLDDVRLIRRGEPDPAYREARGTAVMAKPEYTIGIDLGRGRAGVRVWTCDFSYDYVKINAEYRT